MKFGKLEGMGDLQVETRAVGEKVWMKVAEGFVEFAGFGLWIRRNGKLGVLGQEAEVSVGIFPWEYIYPGP